MSVTIVLSLSSHRFLDLQWCQFWILSCRVFKLTNKVVGFSDDNQTNVVR